eukprot:9364509-Alexandrium_andersonii.AAC.1
MHAYACVFYALCSLRPFEARSAIGRKRPTASRRLPETAQSCTIESLAVLSCPKSVVHISRGRSAVARHWS